MLIYIIKFQNFFDKTQFIPKQKQYVHNWQITKCLVDTKNASVIFCHFCRKGTNRALFWWKISKRTNYIDTENRKSQIGTKYRARHLTLYDCRPTAVYISFAVKKKLPTQFLENNSNFSQSHLLYPCRTCNHNVRKYVYYTAALLQF